MGTRGIPVMHIWGTFDVVAFKVILRSFDAFAIFPKRCCFYAYYSFSTTHFTDVPFDSPYKVASWKFERSHGE